MFLSPQTKAQTNVGIVEDEEDKEEAEEGDNEETDEEEEQQQVEALRTQKKSRLLIDSQPPSTQRTQVAGKCRCGSNLRKARGRDEYYCVPCTK